MFSFTNCYSYMYVLCEHLTLSPRVLLNCRYFFMLLKDLCCVVALAVVLIFIRLFALLLGSQLVSVESLLEDVREMISEGPI